MSFGLNFGCRNNFNNFNNFGNPRFANQNFVGHICNFVGETVTIFTTSGGASGCGFTGILLSVNCDFCRLSTHIGAPPANPLSEHICPDFNGFSPENIGDFSNPGGSGDTDNTCGCGKHCGHCGHERDHRDDRFRNVGSVVDIPLGKIAAFCHNAV